MSRPSRWLLLATLTAAGCSPSPPTAVADRTAAAALTRGQPKKVTLTWAVEQPGTMEHRYTIEEFGARYRESFGEDLP